MMVGEFMHSEKGYHGTLDHKAEVIMRSHFIHSKKNSEWLGNGVYFFSALRDAKRWARMESEKEGNESFAAAVLEADLECPENQYYDLDNRDLMNTLVGEAEELLKGLRGKSKTKLTEAQIRCAACNWFALKHGISIYAYTFPLKIKTNNAGFPYEIKHRQLCVRKDACIRNLNKCFKEEVSDNAI